MRPATVGDGAPADAAPDQSRPCEALVHDLPDGLRVAAGRAEQSTAVIADSRTMQPTSTGLVMTVSVAADAFLTGS